MGVLDYKGKSIALVNVTETLAEAYLKGKLAEYGIHWMSGASIDNERGWKCAFEDYDGKPDFEIYKSKDFAYCDNARQGEHKVWDWDSDYLYELEELIQDYLGFESVEKEDENKGEKEMTNYKVGDKVKIVKALQLVSQKDFKVGEIVTISELRPKGGGQLGYYVTSKNGNSVYVATWENNCIELVEAGETKNGHPFAIGQQVKIVEKIAGSVKDHFNEGDVATIEDVEHVQFGLYRYDLKDTKGNVIYVGSWEMSKLVPLVEQKELDIETLDLEAIERVTQQLNGAKRTAKRAQSSLDDANEKVERYTAQLKDLLK